MKKPRLSILVTVTLVFVAFTAGFFLGRNGNHGGVELSVPPAVLTEPTETSVPATAAAPSETTGPTQTAETQATIVFPIDINTADAETLTALPGIGAVLAERSVAYRREYGPFPTVYGLMNVKGIGEKRMEAILDLITVGGTQ